jgi:hypothetical protein
MMRALTTIALAIALVATMGLAGCSVSPPEGKLACQSDEDCPPDWVCNSEGDEMCYSDESLFPSSDSDSDSDTDADSDSDSDSDGDTDTQTSPDECSEAVWSFDFESGDQGFSHGTLQDGDPDPWERGDPADQTCSSGDNCWATGLDGDYQNCTSAELVSPVFDLSSCADDPLEMVLRFQHHYVFQPMLFDTYRDGGAVQLSSDGGDTWQAATPDPGYQGEVAGDYGGPCNNVEPEIAGQDAWSEEIPGGDWVEVTITLDDELKTADFRFRFLVGSDRTWQETGWVIDDVELVAE